jgi:hypothetical protein
MKEILLILVVGINFTIIMVNLIKINKLFTSDKINLKTKKWLKAIGILIPIIGFFTIKYYETKNKAI